MPRNNGIYTLPSVYRAEPGTTIRSEQHNAPLEDIAQALTNSLPRDGSAGMTGNLPMAGRRITNLGAATQASDAARLDQIPPDVSAWVRSLSELTMAADRLPYATGADTAALTTLTEFARSFLAAVDAASARNSLGLTAAATMAVATQAQAAAGTDNTTIITPQRARQATGANIAAAGVLDIGGYMMARYEGADFPVAAGGVVVGTDLLATNVNANTVSGSLPGTWACCGFVTSANAQTRTTIWKRVS